MDLLGRKRLREKERQLVIKKAFEEEKVFKEGNKPYAPSTKKLTIILFILIIAATIYILLDYKVVVNDECSLMPTVGCANLQITSTQIGFDAINYMKEDINVTISVEDCAGNTTNYIKPNMGARFTFDCDVKEKIADRTISVTYTGYSGLPHSKTGYLKGKRS
jgi:hypothetical protein